MDIKDLRIGDIVSTKTKLSTYNKYPKVIALDNNDEVALDSFDDYNEFEFKVDDICGCKVNNELLEQLGGIYDLKAVQHVFTFSGGLRISIRPQTGTENYIATRIGEYRPKYCYFTYIHQLQHWLWDVYKVEL